MHFFADENFPGPVVRMLREKGHDVLSVKEVARGAVDPEVLRLGNEAGRVLLTFDKDFGELAVRFASPAVGIVLFRLSGATPEEDNSRAFEALQSRTDWVGHFSVVTDDRIRMRPLTRRS
ncbi:MAG: DUF5615 family PIN-like protein [Tepidisphaerales bacterium]